EGPRGAPPPEGTQAEVSAASDRRVTERRVIMGLPLVVLVGGRVADREPAAKGAGGSGREIRPSDSNGLASAGWRVRHLVPGGKRRGTASPPPVRDGSSVDLSARNPARPAPDRGRARSARHGRVGRWPGA